MNTTEQNQVIEDNRLIAEFIGFYGNPTTKEPITSINKDSKYHESWDWLMPVIEKIEGYGASLLIGRFFCQINYTDAFDSSNSFEIRMASGIKLNATYGAIVKFIKWYNDQNK